MDEHDPARSVWTSLVASARQLARRGLGYLLLRPLWAVVVTVLAAGCDTSLSQYIHNGFKVGPNYHSPGGPVSKRWIDDLDPRVSIGEPNLATWWTVFDDPVLNKLIHQAYTQNLTLREAGVLIQQAQRQLNIARAELLPQAQSVVAGYSHGVVSRYGVSPAGGPAFGTALAPSAVLSGLATPNTPIGGANSFGAGAAAAGTTTTGTSPLLNSSVGAGGAGSGIPMNGSRFFDNVGTTANFSWELDFWGLFRRNLEAAKGNLDQSMHNRDEMVVQFLANVATQYVQLRTLQKRLALAHQNVALQEPLVSKLRQQYEAGIATSKPAYFQLKSNLDNTRALIPPLEIALRVANNQLCTLLGLPTQDLIPELGDGTVPDPRNPSRRINRIPRPIDDRVVVGIPADILLRRPDVLALEDQLKIQSASIGIAEAELLPHMGINGSIGVAGSRLSNLFTQQSLIGSIGPSLTWNIMNYGRLLSNVRIQNNIYQEYVLAYQQGILNANQDVENSLVSYLQSLEQSKHLTDSANDAIEVTKYYYDQVDIGYLPPAATSLTFYNQIFTATNFRVTQQDAAAQAEGNIALNMILLYRAMGGGWQLRLQDPDGAGKNCAPGGPPAELVAHPSEHKGDLKPTKPVQTPDRAVVFGTPRVLGVDTPAGKLEIDAPKK